MSINIHLIKNVTELEKYYKENNLNTATSKIQHLKIEMNIVGSNACGQHSEEEDLLLLEDLLFSKLYPVKKEQRLKKLERTCHCI